MHDTKTILIVDDDLFFREILRQALQDRYSVIEAVCGEDALALAREGRADLIILDIEMPGRNGIDVCRELKEIKQTRSTPVILLSARTHKNEIVLGLQAGADDYLTKPIHVPEVLARVDAHLRSRDYYAELEYRDLVMLLELSESIAALRNPMKILHLVVERMAEVAGMSRCSFVSCDGGGILTVKASSDLDTGREITLEMDRYPEISKALTSRQAVVVNDIGSDPLMESVRKHVASLEFKSVIVVPVIKKESVIGTFLLSTTSCLKDGISDRVFKLCHLVANISANALENATLFETMSTAQKFLEEMTIRDGLTRLYTHRHFYERLDEEFSRAVRYRLPLSLIFFDVDNFKRINDTYGHTRGDVVLRKIGWAIRGLVRESDVPVRYGGEEFAVLLPNTGTDGALDLARRLSSVIRALSFENLGDEHITVSIGVSTYAHKNLENHDQLVSLADRAMYQAKAAGKDQIVEATDPSLSNGLPRHP